jgi:anti-anti-sigma factor
MTLVAVPLDAKQFRGIDVSHEGLRMVVSLTGEHDLATAPAVADALLRASRIDRSDFIVDLSEVEFFDTSIVEVFVCFHRFLELQSREFILRGASPFARRTIEICRDPQLLRTSLDADLDALERLPSRLGVRRSMLRVHNR